MIKRYNATKDNTITNAFRESLATSGSQANMGASDILEVFSIYGQVVDESGIYSREEARILIEFDIAEIQADIDAGTLDAGASFYLRLFNAEHGRTLPMGFQLEVDTITAAWEEGTGLDMESYNDLTYGNGSSWEEKGAGVAWTSEGGDYTAAAPISVDFDEGYEDLLLDITTIVNAWLATPATNHGLIIKLPQALAGGQPRSYYTKMFFARGTSNFFKKPVIEARSNSQTTDHRKSFLSDVESTVYLYNEVRGQLTDITPTPTVAFYETLGAAAITETVGAVVTSPETGVYKAVVTLPTSASTIYDVWSSGATEVVTGSITVLSQAPTGTPEVSDLVVSVLNNQDVHYSGQTSRFYFYIREKDWSPNIFTVATSRPDSKVYDNLKFKISKVVTDEVIFDYNMTDGSTTLSYDSNGNFFDLDISLLEPNYVYEIKLALFNVMTKSYQELPFKHRFRVVNNEY
jgi:hypothetical protein